MRLESSIKRIQIRGYKDDEEDPPRLYFDVELEGDMGLISSLNGKEFYKNVDAIWDLLSLEYGVSQIFGTVLPNHAKIIKRLLRGRFNVKFLRKVRLAGRNMILVRVMK
jgi:hypothetical protein